MLFWGLLHVWPIHCYALFLIWSDVGSWLVRCSLDIFLGHATLHMCRRCLLVKTWISWCSPVVSLQVSHPYSRTDLTLVLNILIFVLSLSVVKLHTGLSIAKACRALLILALIPSCEPPVLLIMDLLRSLYLFQFFPLDCDWSTVSCLNFITFVFLLLILSPTFFPILLNLFFFSLMSFYMWDSRAKSSAKSRSSNLLITVSPLACKIPSLWYSLSLSHVRGWAGVSSLVSLQFVLLRNQRGVC